MRTTRTAVAPRSRRPAVAGIRRPRPDVTSVSEVDTDETVDTAEAADPAADLDVSDDTDTEVEPDEELSARRRIRLPVILLLAAALLIGGGAWALVRADAAAAGVNVALVDTAGTAEVTRQVREGLEKVFTYRHDNTAATEEAARAFLTGPALEQYDRLFRQVREQAPAQQLTLTTRVVSSGVVSLGDDTAVLLVFLDQSAVRGDNGDASTAGAQLSVTATLAEGTWRITELTPR